MALKHFFTKALGKFVIGEKWLKLRKMTFQSNIPKTTIFRHASQIKAHLMFFKATFAMMYWQH